MSFQPRSNPFNGVRPQRPKAALVVAIGSRATVAAAPEHHGRVRLTDQAGSTVLHTLREGALVEIVAWQPFKGGATRYRVRSADSGVEGWLSADTLAPCAPPPAPRRAAEVAPPAAGKTAARAVRAPRPSARK